MLFNSDRYFVVNSVEYPVLKLEVDQLVIAFMNHVV